MMDKKEKTKSIIKYLNIVGMAAFTAVTAVQTVLGIIWISKNLFVSEGAKTSVFRYKGLGTEVIMFAACVLLLYTVIKDVLGQKKPLACCIIVALYITTLPIVLSVNFDVTLFGVCIALLLFQLVFLLRYFYGQHERRLFLLAGNLVVLVLLSYLNRAAFWIGIFETFVFLTIQLIRNIGIRRKNIGDKSWRNTLLLFCILIIIMLTPQYCEYNNIKHTLYSQSVKEQLAARVLVPYIEAETRANQNQYILGVIRKEDFSLGHPYQSFRNIIKRYEKDDLNMDTIWNNLYKNAYYRYRKTIAKRYVRDTARGYLAPFLIKSEMTSEELPVHHGFYFAKFAKHSPALSEVYMKFGLFGLFGVTAFSLVQIIAAVIIDLITKKGKFKLEEGRHKKIEAIILVLFFGMAWTAIQTVFTLEGTSYVSSMGSTLVWLIISSFVWFRDVSREE